MDTQASLNAGLLVSRDDELVVAQCLSLPAPLVQVQARPWPGSEDPAAAAASPALAGALLAGSWLAAPLLRCGVLKIGYDLTLWRACRWHPLQGD